MHNNVFPKRKSDSDEFLSTIPKVKWDEALLVVILPPPRLSYYKIVSRLRKRSRNHLRA